MTRELWRWELVVANVTCGHLRRLEHTLDTLPDTQNMAISLGDVPILCDNELIGYAVHTDDDGWGYRPATPAQTEAHRESSL